MRTSKTNSKKIHSQQKHTLRIAHNKNRYYHSKGPSRSCRVYKLNFTEYKYWNRPRSFWSNIWDTFSAISNTFLKHKIQQTKTKLGESTFQIFIRVRVNGAILLLIQIKNLNLVISLKAKLKTKLLDFENEITSF